MRRCQRDEKDKAREKLLENAHAQLMDIVLPPSPIERIRFLLNKSPTSHFGPLSFLWLCRAIH